MFPDIAARWERWWQFAAERPLLHAVAATGPGIYRGKAFHLIDHPGHWLETQRLQLANTHYVADALPRIRADIGPVAIAAFLGAPLSLSEAEQTAWQEAVIADWEHAPELRFDPDNPWFKRVVGLLAMIADDARGRYLVCTPDLTGAIDTLVNLRGPDRMCLDLFDHREAVMAAAMKIMAAWEPIYATVMDTVLDRGAGITQWLDCWSNRPFTIPTCDFNALLGKKDFAEVCLPSLVKQAEIAGRLLFHLDGPQAARTHRPWARRPGSRRCNTRPGRARRPPWRNWKCSVDCRKPGSPCWWSRQKRRCSRWRGSWIRGPRQSWWRER